MNISILMMIYVQENSSVMMGTGKYNSSVNIFTNSDI